MSFLVFSFQKQKRMRTVTLFIRERDASFLIPDTWRQGSLLLTDLPSKNCKLRLHSVSIINSSTASGNVFIGFPLRCTVRIADQEVVCVLKHNSTFGAVYQLLDACLLRIPFTTHMLSFQFKFSDPLVNPDTFHAVWSLTAGTGIKMLSHGLLSSSNASIVNAGALSHWKEPAFHTILVGRAISTNMPAPDVLYVQRFDDTPSQRQVILYESQTIAVFFSNSLFTNAPTITSVLLTSGTSGQHVIVKLNGFSESSYDFGTDVRNSYNQIGISNALFDANSSYFNNATRFVQTGVTTAGRTWSMVFSNLYATSEDLRYIRFAMRRDNANNADSWFYYSILVTYEDLTLAFGYAPLTPAYLDNRLLFVELDLYGFTNTQGFSFAQNKTRILSIQLVINQTLPGLALLQIGPVLLFNASGRVTKIPNSLDVSMRFQLGD